MDREDLIELREVFRARMKEEDFCIGEAKVEKIFRELLGEPEPKKDPVGHLNKQEKEVLETELLKMVSKMTALFEREDSFYKRMRS